MLWCYAGKRCPIFFASTSVEVQSNYLKYISGVSHQHLAVIHSSRCRCWFTRPKETENICGSISCLVKRQTSCAPPSGSECSAAPAGRAFPLPAQRLAGVCGHPLRGSAGWSRLCQHLLLHQQGGQVTCWLGHCVWYSCQFSCHKAQTLQQL